MILLYGLGLTALLLFLGMPVFWAWRLALRYPVRSGSHVSDDQCPRATVLLSIRGADPSLRHCLEGLLAQDYPNYDIHIIVDNAADPAWEIVRKVVADRHGPTVKIALLERRYDTCSLKLSALIQALKELDDSFGVVATIDSDVVPHPSWLRELAAPLADPRVGAATGIRWYMPVRGNLGTLVRHFWNAGAVTQMAVFDIAWGGSLAYRAELFRSTDLLERWQHSFGEDTASMRVLRECGLRLAQVPAATMVNREEIDLKGCFHFVRRQLLSARLDHPSWRLILVTNLGTLLAMVLAVSWSVVALATEQWLLGGCLAGMAVGYGAGVESARVRTTWYLNQREREQGELKALVLLPWDWLYVIPATLAVHCAGLVSALLIHKVDWRGVTYEIGRRAKVRLVEYRPYCPPVAVGDKNSLV